MYIESTLITMAIFILAVKKNLALFHSINPVGILEPVLAACCVVV